MRAMLFPKSSEIMSGRYLSREMTVVRPLTLTVTIFEPQLPLNFASLPQELRRKLSADNISQKEIDATFPATLFLLSWLRIPTNALFRSSDIMYFSVSSNTYSDNNLGATPT